ncbi:MAG: HAMP domain-containing sensor histidine kinase [Elusimicrobiota bacterium]
MRPLSLRGKLAAITFAISSVCLSLLIADRFVASRRSLHEPLKARGQALAEVVAYLAQKSLKAGDDAALDDTFQEFLELPRVAYVALRSPDGALSRYAARPGAGPDKWAAETSDGGYYRATAAIGSRDAGPGSVEIGIGTEGMREAVAALLWRGAAIAGFAAILLAGLSWWLGRALGRRLCRLAEAAERMRMGEAFPPLPKDAGSDEVSKLTASLRRLHKQLESEHEQRVRLEKAKDRWSSMLVHDLKNPLTVIDCTLRAAKGGDLLTPEWRQKLLPMARLCMRRIDNMVEDLLHVSKLEAAQVPLNKDRISVPCFIRECGEENAVLTQGSGRRWRLELPDSLSEEWIYADWALLRRLVGNLVSNALQNSPRGSTVTLGARSPGPDGRMVEFYVKDEGPGVPPELREKIFRPFESFASDAAGVGLGLAFCRMAAERHSGKVNVAFEDGRGSEFSIVLPALRQERPEEPERAVRAGR